MNALEKLLDEYLVKKAPLQIPKSGRKIIAEWMPWICLIFGLLQLWAAFALWGLAHSANVLINYANTVYEAAGTSTRAPGLGMLFWVSMIVLIIDAIIVIIAFPGLRKRRISRGWNFVFYALIINVVYGLARLLGTVVGGFGSFFWSVVFTTLGAYVLFQIRDQYSDDKNQQKTK